jgi:hypothetical protein
VSEINTSRRNFLGGAALGAVATSFTFGTDDFTVVRTQDVEPILDRNRALQNHGHNGWTKDRAFRHVAEIPLVVAEDWMKKYGVDVFNKDHGPAVRRLLNSSEWSYLRTSGGQLRR